jgi:ubiquinone biosynthesis protein
MLWQVLLISYGFGDRVRRMGMVNALEHAGHALHWKQADEPG